MKVLRGIPSSQLLAPRELCSRCGGYRLLIDTATKRLVKCSACNGTSPNAGCKSDVNVRFLKVAA